MRRDEFDPSLGELRVMSGEWLVLSVWWGVGGDGKKNLVMWKEFCIFAF